MDRQKLVKVLDNFWYYYKVHVLVSIIVIMAFLYILFSWGQTRDAAINVVIVGSNLDEEQQLNLQESATRDLLGDNSDSIINLDFWLAPYGLVSGRHGDLQGKLTAMVSGKEIDVLIMDTNSFHFYIEQGTFLKIESLKDSLPEDTQYVQAKGTGNAHGIKMDNNQRLKQAGFDTDDKVLAIAASTEHLKLSSQWVKWIVKKN